MTAAGRRKISFLSNVSPRFCCIATFPGDWPKPPAHAIGKGAQGRWAKRDLELRGGWCCGGLVHGGQLVLPDAVSERASRVALVDLADLLTALPAAGP
jgi:hypothetical protein